MKYLFETHAHTAEVSPCSLVPASDLIKEYHDNGYHGVVLTDHVGEWAFGGVNGSWSKKIDRMVKTYQIAKNTGDQLSVQVLFGMEIALSNPYRDYLVYGFDVDLLYRLNNAHKMNLKQFHAIAQKENFLIIPAHPMRYLENALDVRYIHGIEVYNGNPRHHNNNHLAKKWAQENQVMQISGSDFHQYGDISAGIYLPSCPNSMDQFVKILKSGEYELYP